MRSIRQSKAGDPLVSVTVPSSRVRGIWVRDLSSPSPPSSCAPLVRPSHVLSPSVYVPSLQSGPRVLGYCLPVSVTIDSFRFPHTVSLLASLARSVLRDCVYAYCVSLAVQTIARPIAWYFSCDRLVQSWTLQYDFSERLFMPKVSPWSHPFEVITVDDVSCEAIT